MNSAANAGEGFLAEAPGVWRRGSLCTNSGCVEVAFHGPAVGVRDSKHSESPVLVFDRGEWEEFIAAVKAGEFDAPRSDEQVTETG